MYCIDTSAILEGWVRRYPIDVFPTLWDRLAKMIAEGDLVAPDEVGQELSRKDDGAFEWASARQGLFVELVDEVQVVTSEILSRFPRLVKADQDRTSADPFVIAVARVQKLTVVTQEQAGGESKPRIPMVCAAYDIPCIDLLGLMKAKGWQFR